MWGRSEGGTCDWRGWLSRAGGGLGCGAGMASGRDLHSGQHLEGGEQATQGMIPPPLPASGWSRPMWCGPQCPCPADPRDIGTLVGGACGQEMPPCLCVCACVSEGGGGGVVAHLLDPLLVGVGTCGAGKCVPGAPDPDREAGEPDAEPAGADVGLGSQSSCHRDKLPNRSTTACRHGKAVVRSTTGVRPTPLDCLRHRWCCHVGWVWLPTACV